MSPIGTRCLRRPFVWLLIVQQFWAGSGVSLSCPPTAAGLRQRYPCEQCGCGCLSAMQCWTRCSCFTYEEKVAWAKENGVAVPEYAVAAAKQEATAPRRPPCPHGHGHCPLQAGGPSHVDHVALHREHKREKARSPRGVSWTGALRCHGLTQQWQAVTGSWPGDRHVECRLVLLPCGLANAQPFPAYLFSPTPPPTPPPNSI
jgi:hypothetical protein